VDEIAAVKAALERQHRELPLRPVLAIAIALACGLGAAHAARCLAARGPAAPAAPPPLRSLVPIALAALAALVLVALLSPST
jgi:hypothetical protein